MTQPPNGRSEPAAQHVAPYLEQALALPPGERDSWLTHLTSTQPAIAQLVQALLAEGSATHPEAQTELRMAGGTTASAGLATGAVVGGYRLIRENGYGGMSSVWLAQRCDGNLQREVALKLPMIGPARMHLAERFRRERDILATLTHPNIARLYDAGISSSGQPFLAMEYVEGKTLVSHCESERLTLRERLHVFLQVLEAVQFAHAQLVVHRDLKPSNILVTTAGRVVLLDFGIAKLLSEDEMEQSSLTQVAGRPFTPDYASPEQITGLPLGTGTDIYSLGVLLYELLTGAHPYGTHKASLAQLQQAILTHDPPRPSQLPLTDATAESRRSTSRKLASALNGDLDTVILKALKKDPSERYVSVNAFAQDILNHLHSVPVSARPDSQWYRFSRFTMRNKLAAAAGSVAIVAIVVGAAIALWQMRIAEAERDRAFELSARSAAITEFMMTLLTEAAASSKPVTMGTLLERGEKLVRADTAAPQEQRALVLTTIATQYNSIGDDSRTIPLLEDALALLENTSDRGLRSQLRCDYAMQIAGQGRLEEGLRTIEQELAALGSDDPENESYCLLYRAFIAQGENDAANAFRYSTAALQRFRAAPRTTTIDTGLFLSVVAFAHSMNGRFAEADRFYRDALQAYTRVGRGRGPNTLSIRNNWAVMNSNAGVPGRALELYDETLSIAIERDPDAAPPAFVITNRARTLAVLGRYRESIQDYEKALQVLESQKNPTGEAYALLGLAYTNIELGDAAGAAKSLQQFADRLTPILPPTTPPWTIYTLLRAKLAVLSGRAAEARPLFEKALAGKPSDTNVVNALLGQAEVDLFESPPAAALQKARQALAIAERMQGGVPYSNRTGVVWLMLGRAAQQAGDATLSSKAFESAVLHLTNTVDTDHPALVRARAALLR